MSSTFESAADAVVTGDAETLDRLLRQEPQLVHMRSSRVHTATLLHYLGANGVENERQRSPQNAVSIAKLLLDAGAEVDAAALIYGKSTTLGLVASSIHPKRAGVQMALMDTLLHYGASVDGTVETGSPLNGALRNGHGRAAEFLAKRGAHLDFEGAAGVGHLETVRTLFDSATKEQRENGFLWACEYGHNSMVDFLINEGMSLEAVGTTGLPGLHWAVVGAEIETIKLLLERGASLTSINRYGGTALGQALWCEANSDSGTDHKAVVNLLRTAK